MLNRRGFLFDTVRTLTGMKLAWWVGALAESPVPLLLQSSKKRTVEFPSDFVGLGYEMSSVATPGLLSASNQPYVRLVRALGADGVIRVGGIVSDYTRYVNFGIPKAEPKDTIITREMLTQFNGFLGAVGWKAIWSLNFAQGTIDDAVIEARAVASTLGTRLLAFELGNEVENHAHGDKPFRSTPYTYDRYRSEYGDWRSRILQAVPGAGFAAPDTAASVEWVERMAGDANRDVQLLTTHYYRGGQKDGTANQLLYPDARLKSITERLHAVSATSGIPWRMCETNSFFGGGRPGVSDTFVGTLWTLDFMLFLAANGCAGVNIETGVNQLGFISSYSPIGEDEKGRPRAGAPYYGMLAFATATRHCSEIASVPPTSRKNVSAYVLGTNGKSRSAVIINRGDDVISMPVESFDLGETKSMRLIAPALNSVDGITFAGSEVGIDGSWVAKQAEPVAGTHLVVPPMSALVLLSRQST